MTATMTTALFDVDGTLVDTNYLHAVTWWEAFSQAGYDVPMASLHRAIGMGSDQLLDALLPAARERAGDRDISASHRALYGTYRHRIRPFAKAGELLRSCREAGHDIVLATSAEPHDLAMFRAALRADDVIRETVSGSDVESTKPAPDLVQVAMDKVSVPPERAIFIGDSVWDVRACERASVPCIGLACGGTSRAELLDAGAVAAFGDPADVLASTKGALSSVLKAGSSTGPG
ncbi:MAG TPA: HAD family hydrolase [Streptosporangiaceae bacterium]|nr:HAD family hydrolase [Streptosporangiaceae bacterium]